MRPFASVSQEIQSAYRLPKYYFTDLESWLKWSSYILAFVETIQGASDNWQRFVATLAILLSWAELMFQMSRNPNWGFYINMFSKVAVNVLKVSKHTRLLQEHFKNCACRGEGVEHMLKKLGKFRRHTSSSLCEYTNKWGNVASRRVVTLVYTNERVYRHQSQKISANKVKVKVKVKSSLCFIFN
jgi:hypothetical protein